MIGQWWFLAPTGLPFCAGGRAGEAVERDSGLGTPLLRRGKGLRRGPPLGDTGLPFCAGEPTAIVLSQCLA